MSCLVSVGVSAGGFIIAVGNCNLSTVEPGDPHGRLPGSAMVETGARRLLVKRPSAEALAMTVVVNGVQCHA